MFDGLNIGGGDKLFVLDKATDDDSDFGFHERLPSYINNNIINYCEENLIMHLIDLHCDTIWRMIESTEESTLRSDSLCVNLDKMKDANTAVQFFACFLNMKKYESQGMAAADKDLSNMLSLIQKEVDAHHTHLAFAKNAHQIRQNMKDEKISVLLTLEEGGVIDGNLSRLNALYEAGIRLITLTWNYENCIGFPNSKDVAVMGKGLKPFGVTVVEQMNELGMMIDVSHLSDGGFWDVLHHSKHPIVASHSNARTLHNHPRNLSDPMLRALGETGGITGINLCPFLLGEPTHIGTK